MIKVMMLCFFILLSSLAKSQNLTGTWEGSTSNGAEYWRIGIVQFGDSCFGYSYDAGPGYCYQNFTATYNKKENKFKGEGNSFISKTFDHVLIATTLRYEKEGKTEYLLGTVRSKSIVSKIFSLGIGVGGRLKKISNDVDSTAFIKSVVRRLSEVKNTDSVITEVIKKDTALIAANTVKVNDSVLSKIVFEDSVTRIKESRPTVITKTITTTADSVKIILYDDGEIDGDIITIFDNGKIVVNKLLLTKEPYQINLLLPLNNSKHTIELMAENEGSIPPNTAYMLVLAGEERVEVKTSSNKLSNAAIVIQKSN